MRLTPRQRDVLLLIVKGQTNKQIARELGLSPHTIKRHVVRIYDRIGVNSRVEAAVWYTKEGVGNERDHELVRQGSGARVAKLLEDALFLVEHAVRHGGSGVDGSS